MATLIGAVLEVLTGVRGVKTRVDTAVAGIHALEFKIDQNEARQVARHAETTALLNQILAAVTPSPAVGISFTFVMDGQTFEGVNSMVLKDTQKATASINPVDAKGFPASVDGVPTWESSNAEVFTVTAEADGKSATITAGNPGTAQLIVRADADLGEGVKELTGTADIEVLAGEAVNLAINVAAPTEA